MKKKELEIILQKVPLFDNPKSHLEQYVTPANIAADILFIAYHLGDINDKIIIDFGCGTGIFSIGASYLGAKKIYGFDIDKKSIEIAQKYSKENNLSIEFFVENVEGVDKKCNTLIMNPPFGAQKGNRQADRKFIEKGFEIAEIIYSLHLKKTIPFIEKMITSLGGIVTHQKEYLFPIKWQFNFHKKEISKYDVTLLRIRTK
jgi:putative methylase